MKKENKPEFIAKLGLTAGITAAGALGLPTPAQAGPFREVKAINPEADSIYWISRCLGDTYTHGPLKWVDGTVVVDRKPQEAIEFFNKSNLSSYPQKLLIRSAERVAEDEQYYLNIPKERRKDLHAELLTYLNPASQEKVTPEQLTKLAGTMERFYNELALTIAPKMPPVTYRPAKMNPPKFLMCLPEEPKADRDFNHVNRLFMKRVQRYARWNAIATTMKAEGAQVILMDPKDSKATARIIYTANTGFYDQDAKTFYAPLQNADPRQIKEQEDMIKGFLKRGGLGLKVVKVDANFNGGNMYKVGDTVFMGSVSSGKTVSEEDIAAFEKVSNLKVAVVPMSQKIEPEFEYQGMPHTAWYDLDCFFKPLKPTGHLLIYPEATTPAGMAMLQEKFGDKLISIRRDDAIHLAANLAIVQGGDGVHSLVMPYCSAELEGVLSGLGYRIVTPEKMGLPSGSFQIADGSVRCTQQELGENFPAQPLPEFIIDLWDGRNRKFDNRGDRVEIILDDKGEKSERSIMLADVLDVLDDHSLQMQAAIRDGKLLDILKNRKNESRNR